MIKNPSKTLYFHNNYDLLKTEIRKYFIHVYNRYETLFECLTESAYYKRADPLRHPLIFYYGHTATFYINKCIVSNILSNKDRIDPYLESTLAIGVDEMSWDDKLQDRDNWPKISRIKDYRKKVFEKILNVIDNLPLIEPINTKSPWWIIMMGIEHENIHLETSSMLVRHLPLDMLIENNDWSLLCDAENNLSNIQKNEIINIESGNIKLGRSISNTLKYGWDNEFGEDLFNIDAFSTSKYLVSNAEFLEFVEDNGYQQKQYWTPDGWNYKSFNNVNNPRFWKKDLNTGNWYLRTLLKEINMPWDWPVEINYLEAKAFCNWKQSKISSDINKIYCRLLTEPEHTLLRNRFVTDDTPANHGLVQQSPCSVFRYNQGKLNDIVGNVWQWTESFIYPFNGFEVHPAYDDFTIPCFDNKHNLIKGSSWVSCGNEIDINSRYAFRQHFYQYAGFRYVITNDSEYDIKYNSNNNPYETDDMVCQYIEFHYGSIYFNIPNYLKICVEECINFLGNNIRFKNAIDIGCSVGRFTFEFAKYCDNILGIDLSARFIQVCYNIRDNINLISYVIPIEGDIKEYKQINPVHIRNDLSISSDDCTKINFLQKDACNLPLSEYNNYDFIFCGNLIDRLSDPKIFIETLHKRMVNGGILVMTSPYTWIETYTIKENWIGGKKISGEDQTTLQTLEILLSPHFELLKVKDIEFVIRETKRKFQHTISEMSIWRRK
jgi:5-histidylcysteine sulfoxide synthase/putative 4-mercaptohistidine N1-methyltranferase